MRTLLFLSPSGTYDNGAEISILNLMSYLVEQGYRVINVIPDYSGEQTGLYIDKCREYKIELHRLPALNWWWEDSPLGHRGTAEESAFFYRDTISRLCQLIREEKVELVLTNTANMFQAAVAAACESVPHYWLIHELPENEFAYYKDKVDFIDSYSEEIFTVSGGLLEALTPLFPLHKLKGFIPFSAINFSQLAAGKEPRILSVGRISQRKNQLELLEAYKQLGRPDIELVFIGGWDDQYKALCDAYIAENQLQHVTFLGNVANPWAQATEKDICVLPSSLETFGLVYVEAVLNGVPTILSDNLGHRSAYDYFGNGDLYSSGDSKQLASKMQQFLDNFEEKKKAALNEVAQAKEKYTLEKAYQELIEAIEQENQQSYSPSPLRHLANLLATNQAGQDSQALARNIKIRRRLSQMKQKWLGK